MNVTKS